MLSFSSAALKCKARDQWIGWEPCFKWQRLHLLAEVQTDFDNGLIKYIKNKFVEFNLKHDQPYGSPVSIKTVTIETLSTIS